MSDGITGYPAPQAPQKVERKRGWDVVADELARCLPHVERATVPNASHLLHGMNPQAYNGAVLAFLAKH